MRGSLWLSRHVATVDPPTAYAIWLCDFSRFSWKKLFSLETTDKGRISTIRESGDIFRKGFIRLCLRRKCKISWGSRRRNYSQSSRVRVNILAMFNVYSKVLQWQRKNLVWFAGVDLSECHRENQRQSYAPAAFWKRISSAATGF